MTTTTHTYLPNPRNTLLSPLATHQVPKEHPRLFGSRDYLKGLAKERPDAYRRTKEIANRDISTPPRVNDANADFGAQISVENKLLSMSLVAAIENDAAIGRAAIELAFKEFLDQPVRVGHIPFGADCGNVAVVYDLCHQWWTHEERERFVKYIYECRDKNVDEEFSPFHDGWWGYKQWGFILALLAVIGDTDKEHWMLYAIDREFRLFAAEALRLSGDGGGYPEGFYVNYYMYHWLLACEAMRNCTGADYLAEAPDFYKNRAIASIFEQYPTIRERGSRRMICVGDGRGRFFKVERDAILAANRLLVGRFKNDPAHQAVNAFLHLTPHCGADENACRELLWFDPKVKQGNLKKFRLSHVSTGPGYVYARSSWEEDATYFFFKSGKRFTAHQHVDNGHFYIFKHEELASEGGHYCDFAGNHGSTYYSRTIAHNSLLVLDSDEKFEFIRGWDQPNGNDGGQAYPWPGTCFFHNGDCCDPDQWRRHPELGDIADLVAYQDDRSILYTVGDITRSYSKNKLDKCTRQIVYIRPGTFIILDRVKSKNPSFKKTWVLHAAKPPAKNGDNLVITNGKGRLHVQTVLPAKPEVKLNQGEDLYRYGGNNYPPAQTYGPGSECRIEVSPSKPAKDDLFLHILTTTESTTDTVPQATATVNGTKVTITLGKTKITLDADKLTGTVTHKGKKTTLARKL